MSPTEDELPEGKCTRREFLWRVSAAGIAAAASGALGFALHGRGGRREVKPAERLRDFRVPPVEGRPRIVAARGGTVEKMLRAGLERIGGMGHFVKAGDVVVLKPNAAFASPPSIGATTHPEVVGAVARLCREAGADEVWVVDNPIHDPVRCMEVSGIAAAAEANGARVFYPRVSAFLDVEEPANAVLKRWPFFHAPFRNATKVIGLPATKHHSLAGVTLGMKNWYGLLGGRRNRLHQDIHASIADLATLVRPTLVILDATRVLFRNGPTGGSMSDVRAEGIIAVGVDPIAIDTYGASLLGREAAELPFLIEAQRRGLGTTDLKDAGFEMVGGARAGGIG